MTEQSKNNELSIENGLLIDKCMSILVDYLEKQNLNFEDVENDLIFIQSLDNRAINLDIDVESEEEINVEISEVENGTTIEQGEDQRVHNISHDGFIFPPENLEFNFDNL